MTKKEIPGFTNIEEEVEFWETHSPDEYLEEGEETDFLILGAPKTETLHVRVEPRVKRQIWEYSAMKGMEPAEMIREWIYAGLEELIEGIYGGKTGEEESDIRETLSEIHEVVMDLGLEMKKSWPGFGGVEEEKDKGGPLTFRGKAVVNTASGAGDEVMVNQSGGDCEVSDLSDWREAHGGK
ncbi:MAG: BrnA antitoxin family protein [Actinobacteria bacterium]|nr:BrnA antitoxin family protein [Actinomycetota bacterium]MBU4217342.1 BrnA antitoxin family protein [Actinomycetota bacterium]MBU4359505.1 BrnA antitoxin family protein [Actinomycetota bacterium]MBU4392895.1 BrnA antitoxin family protein [Actinomycetota bacterium]MBU4403526.1 BrnA antitoxin family protein [Actinomycetota bacterium]